ncbi:hypothetical protein [Nostoc sp. MS1]|nr:hypothetical protein [Nostoc sp. MS1]
MQSENNLRSPPAGGYAIARWIAIAFFIFTTLLTVSLNNNFAFKHFSLIN